MKRASLRQCVLDEQKLWDEFISGHLDASAELLSVSEISSDSRVYGNQDDVSKIRRLTPASIRERFNSLEDEALILQGLGSVESVPRLLGYSRSGGFELLKMTRLQGIPSPDPTLVKQKEGLGSFLRVARGIARLNRAGCSHGDVHLRNVGLNDAGTLSIFDFDQARRGHPLSCWLRDFWGLGPLSRPTDRTIFQRSVGLGWMGIGGRVFLGLKRAIVLALQLLIPGGKKAPRPQEQIMCRVKLLGSGDLELLARAWGLAAASNASSPDVGIAYYSFDVEGIHFPGERPWELRWHPLRRSVNWRGKRVLELGCNMGLLSVHAEMEGTVEAVGVDRDSAIVEAASMMAKALGSSARFLQVDLDSESDWESRLAGFDLVTALSVMHWVADKDRLWRFLARHSEVLYEGHEDMQATRARLVELGFQYIARLGLSERNRELIYASRDPMPAR